MAKHHIIHFVARPDFAPKKKKTKIADEPEGVSDLAKLLHIKLYLKRLTHPNLICLFSKGLVISVFKMRFSMFLGATLLACGFSVFGRPLSPQEESGDLYGFSDFFQGVDGQSRPPVITPPSLDTSFGMNKIIASNFPSGQSNPPIITSLSLGTSFGRYDDNLPANLPINYPDTPLDVNKIISSAFSPNVDESSKLPVIPASTSSGPYDNKLPITLADTSNGLSPNINSPANVPYSGDPLWNPDRIIDIKITNDVLQALGWIPAGKCRYVIWEYNDGDLYRKKCEQSHSVSRQEIRNAVTESGRDFIVVQLAETLILSIHNEYHHPSSFANSLDSNAWERALVKKFPYPLAVKFELVFNDKSLEMLLHDYEGFWH
ncbi:hypothetical protein MMC22_003670 [Lobaria immixta]|nr:hypothetical protein [Lobaria immixta]